MNEHPTGKVYLDEKEDFSDRQSYGRRVVTPIRYSTDPRDIGWVRQNIPCQTACPADTNVPAYIQMILDERYGRSYELNRIANVLPGTLGRVCSRPCEDVCRHGWPGNGAPVNICHLKRVAADLKPSDHRITENLFTPSGKRVAIIGAGPGGIAAAHDLSMLGHDVTIFEREDLAGGMLAYGIPAFRLPRDLLALELRNALRLGVELKAGVAVGNGDGEMPLSKLMADYDAVLMATGAMVATPLPLRDAVSGEDIARGTPNVEYGLDFLIEYHRGVKKTVGKRVAVVGAGFTAFDCARVARRLGARKVTIHIRTTEEYIPVTKDEVHETRREAVKIMGLRTPVE
ncbi:MAG: FAD-dependent oxidoreductase, partial [Pseudomonadota bacterium]|nr:FAD-dependent oxidoreductase [Pseudomonadota bacterium]